MNSTATAASKTKPATLQRPCSRADWIVSGAYQTENLGCDVVAGASFFETDIAPANKWTLSNEKLSNHDHLTGLGYDEIIVHEMLCAGAHKNWMLCTPQEIRRQARHSANKLTDEGIGSYSDPDELDLHDVDSLSEPLPIPEHVINRILRAIDAAADVDIEAAAAFTATDATQSPPPHPPVKGGILHVCITPRFFAAIPAPLPAPT